MQSSQEKPIDLIYQCQITPKSYQLDNQANTINYVFNQKLNINTVNLTGLSFYNAFPNINQFYNTFQVKIGTTEHSVVIPSYNYNFWDINDMITIFNTQINLQITGYGTWTFSLTGNNNRFVQLTNSSGTAFTFIRNLFPQYNQLLQYIGFGLESSAYRSPNSTQISPFPYNVQVSQMMHVTCRNLYLNTEIQSCLATIPINAPIQQLIWYTSPFYQCNRHILTKNNSFPVQDIQLGFLDDNGFPLIMNNNRISAVLMFEKYVQ